MACQTIVCWMTEQYWFARGDNFKNTLVLKSFPEDFYAEILMLKILQFQLKQRSTIFIPSEYHFPFMENVVNSLFTFFLLSSSLPISFVECPPPHTRE